MLFIFVFKNKIMALFTIRFELLSLVKEDFQLLYNALQLEGFTNTIRDDAGAVFILPSAEYNKEGEYTKDQVLDSAIRAAHKTGNEYAVLVTESNGRSWANLIQVK